MKEKALALVSNIKNPSIKLNILREYIQALVLRSLHESEAFNNLSFVGGTALRFIHSIPRFSEDLDFSLETHDGYNPEIWMKKIKTDLSLAGFNILIKWNATGTVHKAWIKIDELLQDAGLSAMKNQNLSIKLEIDTNPPEGAVCIKTILTNYVNFVVQHHNLPSLMAGKLNALLTRQYTKGRDWYDLLWYRGKRPVVEPNLILLQNALNQFRTADDFKADDWKQHLLAILKDVKNTQLVEDVAPFLEYSHDAELLTPENLALSISNDRF